MYLMSSACILKGSFYIYIYQVRLLLDNKTQNKIKRKKKCTVQKHTKEIYQSERIKIEVRIKNRKEKKESISTAKRTFFLLAATK